MEWKGECKRPSGSDLLFLFIKFFKTLINANICLKFVTTNVICPKNGGNPKLTEGFQEIVREGEIYLQEKASTQAAVMPMPTAALPSETDQCQNMSEFCSLH
jgi:hypothetical protein